jgi:hypothetical protein
MRAYARARQVFSLSFAASHYPHLTTEEASMGNIRSTVMLYVTRWLLRRRWGRRLLFVWAMRTLRTRVRQFLRDLADLYPVLKPAAAWV